MSASVSLKVAWYPRSLTSNRTLTLSLPKGQGGSKKTGTGKMLPLFLPGDEGDPVTSEHLFLRPLSIRTAQEGSPDSLMLSDSLSRGSTPEAPVLP